jgi:mannosyltransferase
MERTSHQWITLLLLVLILAFALLLRIKNLGGESLWLDEASSVKLAQLPAHDILDEVARTDVHPPLYYLMLHYWVRLAGDSERGVRLLSALFGTLSILVAYQVASLLFDRSTGLISALLLSVSLLHIALSQEARMYALLCLLSLLSVYFFLRLLRGESGLLFAAYVLSTALLPYTQVYGWFVIIAQNIFFLSLYFLSPEIFKRLFKRWAVAQALTVALFLPWLPAMLQQVSRVQKNFWIPAPSLRLLGLTVDEYIVSNALQWIHLLLIALSIIALWGSQRGAASSDSTAHPDASHPSWLQDRDKLYFLLAWLLTPVLVPFILSYLMRPIFLPKYTIAALPAFAILAARGLTQLRFVPARLLLVGLILLFSLSGLRRGYWGTQRKEDWRDAVGYFNQMAKPNDLVLIYPSFSQPPFDYYARRSDVTKAAFSDLGSDVATDKAYEMLDAATKGHDRVWLVLHSLENESTLLMKKHLGERYNLRAQDVLPGIELYLYEGRRTD